MSEKAKRTGGEDILEVFRSEGHNNSSAENYLLKKRTASSVATGPTRKNQITDSTGSSAGHTDAPHAVNLSGLETAGQTNDPTALTHSAADTAQQPAPIHLETFRIDMQERLTAMQAAQQKAKDQLNELKKQNPTTDEPPED